MNFVAIIKVALSLLPAVIEAIKAIEAAIPESGAGAQKLEIIKATLQKAHEVGGDTVGAFEQYWPVLSTMVGSVVTVFNAVGLFKKK